MEPHSPFASLSPSDKTTVMNDLREVLLGNACQIVVSTGSDDLAESYLGISLDEFSLGSMPGSFRTLIAAIDLDRFHISRQIEAAHDFAYQQGSVATRTAFDEDDWNDLALFVEGAARCSFGGEPTPLASEDSALRRAIDMSLARMTLKNGGSLTIRQLALLADIGESAVRTSFSAEGIRTEGKPAKVTAEVAEPWLRRRRGFVPTLEAKEEVADVNDATLANLFTELAFGKVLQHLMNQRGVDFEALYRKAAVEEIWLKAVLEGDAADIDLDALRRLARALEVNAPVFVGRAIEALMSRE